MNHRYLIGSLVLLAYAGWALAEADEAGQPAAAHDPFDCGYLSPEEMVEALRAAVAAGQISDPARQVLPAVRPRTHCLPRIDGGGVPTVTPEDIFPYEDSNGLLLTNFTTGQLLNFMAGATNTVLAAHGDNFDFLGFFLNFTPHHQIGGAFYASLYNDVTGIGRDPFDNRPAYGILSENLQGWVMMWKESSWQPGLTHFTQLVLGQEFEHRYALFLRPFLNGRQLQGNDGSCGRSAHWNFRVDAQGSSMEVAEWVGSSPATRQGGTLSFNRDNGGVFSYPDLYLMGYVSPAEVDTLSSELRYMDNNTSCASPYSGAISLWTSADIIAANGPRVPDWTTAQKDFRTGWIMLHLPGSPPTAGQINNVVAILNDWSVTWQFSTLGRGTMDNTLPDEPLPGDFDGDGDVDLSDFAVFQQCFGGSNNPPAPTCPPGVNADLDGDGDVDLADFLIFQQNFTGSR